MFAPKFFGARALTTLCVLMLVAGSAFPQDSRTNDGDWYHGKFVPDPYRWLETHNAAQTKTWLEEQRKQARKHLDALPRRAEIKGVVQETLNYSRKSVPFCIAGKFYFTANTGLQDQSVLYCAKSLEDSAPQVVLDLNKTYPDAIRTLKNWSVSPDGRYLAYSVYLHGSDVSEWRVRDLSTLGDYSEVLTASFEYPSWHHKIAGFYYPYLGSVYFHRVGSSPANDTLIYSDSGWYVSPTVTNSGRYVVLSASTGTDPRSKVLLRDLEAQGTPNWILVGNADAVYNFICEVDGSLYFRTTSGARKARVVKMSLQSMGTFTEVVPESDDALDTVFFVGGSLFARYIHEGHNVVKIFDLSGKQLSTLELPGKGSAPMFASDGTADGVLYSYSDYVTPLRILQYRNAGDEKARTSKVYWRSELAYDANDFVQEVRFFKSKDGTKVPVTLAYSKKMVKDGQNPVLLYGYGGFHVNLTPHFHFEYMAWMRLGGILAVPNLRGGAEYGEDWWQAGTKLKKQNVFDDYLAAAHWLIDEKYTVAGNIVSSGASNGGLLVGAALTQEPDLFGAALPDVGVLDMIRYAKLGGGSWVSDYGEVNNATEFNALFKYSPLHQVKKGTSYPAVLVTAPDHDDRVNQSHSWKFTATLQWAQAAERPVLLLVTKDAGHIAGYTPTKFVALYTDKWAFCLDSIRQRNEDRKEDE